MVNEYAGKAYHGVGYPERPEWHDAVGFHSHYLMDDQIFQEPCLACRPFMSARRGARIARVTSGPGAINETKKLEEGLPEFCKMIWGLWYDSRDSRGGHWGMGTVTLPELKVKKCKDIFNHASLAPGTRRILIHTVQVARGNGEWAAQVQPLLRIEMKVLDTLLGGASHGASYAQPPLTGDALEEFWVEFDESV